MNNRQLQTALAKKLGKSKDDVSKLLEAFVGIVQGRCGDLDTIALPGFGTFEGVKKNEHIELDKKTGKRVIYPPKVELQFKVSSTLKNKFQ